MSLVREALLVAGKDLRIEARSRVTTTQVLPFGALVVLLFAFALDPDRGVLPRAAPGLFWVAVLLATVLAVGRAFGVEQHHRARDTLRVIGVDGAGVFLGKAMAIAAELVALELVLGTAVVVLYGVEVVSAPVLLVAALAATAGLAATGTLYGVLAAGLGARETLLPLLLLPVAAPVLLGATRAFEAGLGDDSGAGWAWVALLSVFAALYGAIGTLAFGALWEDE